MVEDERDWTTLMQLINEVGIPVEDPDDPYIELLFDLDHDTHSQAMVVDQEDPAAETLGRAGLDMTEDNLLEEPVPLTEEPGAAPEVPEEAAQAAGHVAIRATSNDAHGM